MIVTGQHGTIWRHRSGATLVQAMAWCHLATSHYLSQCCHSCMLTYGITKHSELIVSIYSYQTCYWCNLHCMSKTNKSGLVSNNVCCPCGHYWDCCPRALSWGEVTVIHLTTGCCQASNIICTLVNNKIVDHSDVVGAVPTGAAPATSSFLT